MINKWSSAANVLITAYSMVTSPGEVAEKFVKMKYIFVRTMLTRKMRKTEGL